MMKISRVILLLILILSFIVHTQDDQFAITSSDPLNSTEIDGESQNIQLLNQVGGVSNAVEVQNGKAYVGVGPRLFIFDVSHPDDPIILGKTTPLPNLIKRIAININYTFIICRSNGLHIIDTSNPGKPFEIGYIETFSDPQDLVVSGNIVYLVDNKGLRVIDITDPSIPEEIGFYAINGYSYGVALDADRVFVTASTINSVLIIDISNPSSPELINSYSTTYSPIGLTIRDNLVYLVDDHGQLIILDINDPINPVELGSYYFIDRGVGQAVIVDGIYAYIANSKALLMVDISDPTTPTFESWGKRPDLLLTFHYPVITSILRIKMVDCAYLKLVFQYA